MSTQSQSAALIAAYCNVGANSDLMLAAAKEGNWDAVARLELNTVSLIGTIRRASESVELSDEQLQVRRQVLMRILSNDAMIRQLCEPNLENLGGLLMTPADVSASRILH